MVILLSFSSDELNTCGTDEQISCFAELLANQIRIGAHVFIGEISLFRSLSVDNRLSISAKKIFDLHSKKITFLNQYFNSPTKSIIEVKNEEWLIENSDEYTKFNLKNLIGDGKILIAIKESSIVFENISDEKIYRKIFNYMLAKEKSHEIVHYEAIHGGGNDTYRISREEMNKSYHTFCICDSDFKYGKSPIGQTAKQVIDEFSQKNRSHHVHVIKVHEVENLIPVYFYDQLAKHEQKESVKVMLSASEKSPEHFFCYDIKDAHKFQKVFSANDDFSNYWKSFYDTPDLEEHVKRASAKFASGEADARILPKLSVLCNPVKERFSSEPDNNFPINQSLEVEWNKIFEKIKNWCAATKPITL